MSLRLMRPRQAETDTHTHTMKNVDMARFALNRSYEYEGAKSIIKAMEAAIFDSGLLPGSNVIKILKAARAEFEVIEFSYREACRLRDLEIDAAPEQECPDF